MFCAVIGHSKRSGCDKDISLYRILKMVTHKGKQEYELTKKTKTWVFFSGDIQRCLQSTRVLKNDRICTRNYISGKPAYLYNETNPNWLPNVTPRACKERVEERRNRAMARRKARKEKAKSVECSASDSLLPPADAGDALPGVSSQTELTADAGEAQDLRTWCYITDGTNSIIFA